MGIIWHDMLDESDKAASFCATVYTLYLPERSYAVHEICEV